MTIAEVLLLDYDPEIAGTRRTLERIPGNDPQWKPHDKSMPIGRLAVHVARLPQFCTGILTTPEINMDNTKMPPLVFESTAQLLDVLDTSAAEARAHLTATTDAVFQEKWKLSFKGHTIIDEPKVKAYRIMFLSHLVHHRAQLGVYLRLLNIPVPGLYGPSADEQFG